MGYYFIFRYLQYLISLLYFAILIQFNSGIEEGVSVSSDGNVSGNSSKGSGCDSGSCDGDSYVSPMAAAK
jgi:hypothetical protein